MIYECALGADDSGQAVQARAAVGAEGHAPLGEQRATGRLRDLPPTVPVDGQPVLHREVVAADPLGS